LEDLLKEFGFSEVNTAIANALMAISNTEAANTTKSAILGITLEQVTTMITEAKGKMKEYSTQMKEGVNARNTYHICCILS
jgi:hypothetical protein